MYACNLKTIKIKPDINHRFLITLIRVKKLGDHLQKYFVIQIGKRNFIKFNIVITAPKKKVISFEKPIKRD